MQPVQIPLNLEAFIESLDLANLHEVLEAWHPRALGELISSYPHEKKMAIFNSLSLPKATPTFELLEWGIQKEILDALPSGKAAHILNGLSPDDRTALLEELPSQVVNQLIKLLSNDERALTLRLLGYPESSVGRLMTPDYISGEVRLDR